MWWVGDSERHSGDDSSLLCDIWRFARDPGQLRRPGLEALRPGLPRLRWLLLSCVWSLGWDDSKARTVNQRASTRPLHVAWASSWHGGPRALELPSGQAAQGSSVEAVWTSPTHLGRYSAAPPSHSATSLPGLKGRGHGPHLSMGGGRGTRSRIGNHHTPPDS